MFNSHEWYQQKKQETLTLVQSAITLSQNQGNQKFDRRLQDARKRLIEGKLLVVVCGEFKEGKSSLLNALLNEINDDLFPVDSDIATGIVTTISYGEQEKITVILGEPGKEEQIQIQRHQIDEYVNEQRNKGKQARMLTIQAPNSQLKEGLVLVDTPGVGGLNTQHTGITYGFIPEADVILFVSDVKAPLSTDELKFLKFITERCPDIIPNIIFVATKIDANANYEEIVENNREKLSQVLKRSGKEITIIPVSSHIKLEYLRSKHLEDLEDSNFQALENELWQLLNQRGGYTLLMRSFGELGSVLKEMRIPLQAQLSACQQQSELEVKKLEQQFQKERERLAELETNNANWQRQLNRGLEDISVEISNQFQRGFAKIGTWANGYIADEKLLVNPAEIAALIERDIDTLMSALGRQLSQAASKLHFKIEATSGLNLNFVDSEYLDWEKTQLSTENIQIKQAGWWEKSLNATRSAMFNASAGSVVGGGFGAAIGGFLGSLLGGIGAIPGAVIGGKIGAAIGGVAGSASGVRQGLSQLRERDFASVRNKVTPMINQFISESRQLCNQSLTDAIRSLKRSMEDELSEQIRQLKQTCDRTIRSIQDTHRLTEQQKAEKIKALTIPLQTLEQIHKSVATLASAVIKQKEMAEQHQVAVATQSNKTDDADYGEDWADG
ncbi:dynamin family protein [Phormidium sp. LEGE 05292]|uniref:dynamin family protein n=1 Tax=[Phormidium] sp. LEGE 05292 TaxID=767427 RepID=UPI00187EF19C|nr:dynamin family protein [Phormidium sp. LEGE 05292]MBE9224112.1 dynamin family protein [Phormidium sp. LEGE 05292]